MLLQARRARRRTMLPTARRPCRPLNRTPCIAGHILGQLLDLARAQSLEALASKPSTCAPGAARVLAEHAPLAYERHQELALDAPPRPVKVQGHATMVELILRNLVDNALRHTPGTLVEVRVAQTPKAPAPWRSVTTAHAPAHKPAPIPAWAWAWTWCSAWQMPKALPCNTRRARPLRRTSSRCHGPVNTRLMPG